MISHISKAENISSEQAAKNITITVNSWKTELQKGNVVKIEEIGLLSVNREDQIIFVSSESNNYLKSSFGLKTLKSPVIKREIYEQKPVVVVETPKKNKSNVFLKYAVAVAVLLIIGAIGWKYNQQKQLQTLETEYQKKIQETTFTILNTIPEIKLKVVKTPPKKYHLIAGAFDKQANAIKKIIQLRKKGFNSKIVGVNKSGFTLVSFESHKNREKAIKNLKKIKVRETKNAWLLIE